MHLHLQSKARASFKKLIKTKGNKLVYLAFFYLSDTKDVGTVRKSMEDIKNSLKQFNAYWVKFTTQAPTAVCFSQGYAPKPGILIVADEVLKSRDQTLKTPTRLAVPNTMKESTLLNHKTLENADCNYTVVRRNKQIEARDRSFNTNIMKKSSEYYNITSEILDDERKR
jgi:hypothetical protein